MQSNRSRVALAVVAIALAVVAFLVLRPSDDEEVASGPSVTEGPSSAPDEEESGSGGGPDSGGGKEAAEPDDSGAVEIEVVDGAPAGGVADIPVAKGDEVRLEVSADVEDAVHVHGYDQFAGVAPDDPAKLKFTADIEGIYEIELEGSHTQIAELEVTP